MSERSRFVHFWAAVARSLARNHAAFLGLVVLVSLGLFALFAPILVNNLPLLFIKHTRDPAFAPGIQPGKIYFPIFFEYPEFSFQALGAKSAGRGIERLLTTPPGSTGLPLLVRDDRVTLLFPPLLRYSPTGVNLREALRPPSLAHPMGTDSLGRDLFTRVLYGARVSLSVGIVAQFFALLIGLPLGLFAGYYGNRKGLWIGLRLGLLLALVFTPPFLLLTGSIDALKGSLLLGALGFLATAWPVGHRPGWPGRLAPGADDFILWLINVVSAFPFLLLVIAIVATVRTPDLRIVFVAIGLVGWVEIARQVRGQTISLRERDFVAAVRALGASDARVMLIHILPNVLAPVIVCVTLHMAGTIMIEAGLSFLGLGVQPPDPTWGAMINDGRAYLEVSPWLVIFPGLAIMLTVFSLNLLGDGLREALDPKTREFRE